MILRHLANAVKKQDWFVVLVEVFVVIFGVFIGLQVDDWNQARKDRVLEQEYLQRLYEDVQGSIDDQLATDGWDEARIRTQKLVIEYLVADKLPEKDIEDFEFGLSTFGIMNPLRLRWATVEELKATGRFGIIRDIELRQLLGNFEGDFNRWNSLITFSNQNIIQQRGFISGKYTLSSWKGKEDETRHKPVYDFNALAADKEFIAHLTQIQDNTLFIRVAQKQHVESLRQLKRKIAENLGIVGDEVQ